MEAFIPPTTLTKLVGLAAVVSEDPKAELEVKVLTGQIRTKDAADRIVRAIEEMAVGPPVDEHRATFAYPDGLRVAVLGPENIHKVCTTGSFQGVPLTVERKRKYFDVPKSGGKIQDDVIDIPDLKIRFTLRHEEELRKDFSGAPMDPASHVRIMHRRSWKIAGGRCRVDLSLVKTKHKNHKTFNDILKQTPSYELEIEDINREADPADIIRCMLVSTKEVIAAFQGSPFILSESDMTRYQMEFETLKMRFINPLTLERAHLRADRPGSIFKDYTVTNKADGERSLLFVAKDKRLLRITKARKVTWTGMSATKDIHIGDTVDGEYLADRNLFCIFDIYTYRGKSVMRLPLMTTDEDVMKNPIKSRLGCSHLFVQDLGDDFAALSSKIPMRVETKLFLAGNGPRMQEAIQRILDTKFEYPTDGLIFTPRESPVAPIQERRGDTWTRVYKWKPPTQNSIDFLVKFKPETVYDPILDSSVFKGSLYVSRSPGSDIVYPCETITGEYEPPKLPPDLARVRETQDRVPTPFQPSAPKAPNAYEIYITVNDKGVPVDENGERVENNTIIECYRDVAKNRWVVMRTRYEKTYQYRVLNEPQYGNDINVAENIWTNIHNPITEDMLRVSFDDPPDDTFEDDLYYRDEAESQDRSMKDVRSFHNKVKDNLYQICLQEGQTLLELAAGRAGDLHKWRKAKLSKVVAVEMSAANLHSPKQGACVRYLKAKEDGRPIPDVLFVQGDMTEPLYDQDNAYIRILKGEEPARTPYLEKFANLNMFDGVSCQFAMHYACESEEMFRTFIGNVTTHCKDIFFGTMMDGQAVYSLLMGKGGYTFRGDGQVFGEIKKDYNDGDGWREEFGQAITVKLDSFERPMLEYLVPFDRVVAILRENEFELADTKMMGDHYSEQTQFVFKGGYRAFSFLHRSFVFRRVVKKAEKKRIKKVEEEKAAEAAEAAEPGAAAAGEPEAPKAETKAITKKLVKLPKKKKAAPEAEGPPPVFFFAGSPELNEFKEFSNMHEAPVLIDGIKFPTVEHYYQWSKARLFGDEESQQKILKSASPKTAKTLGKKVKDFNEERWEAEKVGIMQRGIKAKLMQHPDIRKKLLATGDRRIAEANPRGKFWGIGTSYNTSKATNPERWPGKNNLGLIYEELRRQLKE
jgi:ribA/ribD-fused uncharacterized protein